MKDTNKILMCVESGCKNIQGEDGEICQECWDKKYGARVVFSDAYAGGARCDVYIGKTVYVLELSDLSKRLENEITEKGYTTEQSKRQKYPRIIINK